MSKLCHFVGFRMGRLKSQNAFFDQVSEWLFNVTINDISVIYVTAHRCAGGLKKELDLRSGSHAIDIL